MTPPLEPIRLNEKLAAFSDHWNPRIIAELNGQHVKLVKLQGCFVWHAHDEADELFLVLKGRLRMGIRDAAGERWVEVSAGEMILVPRGVEHCPQADAEAHVLLFEPAGTLNTGGVEEERTRRDLETI